jgi:hypothetical protein
MYDKNDPTPLIATVEEDRKTDDSHSDESIQY